jgi:DNA-binding NtrC family response regulator
VAAETFREDLLYRVNVIPVTLPPLRERGEDIPSLVSHFLARIAVANDRAVPSVDPEALEALRRCPWPGNIRQLINALEYAVVTCRGEEIDVPDLPAYLSADPACPPPARRRAALSREAVAQALANAGGNRTAAARALGVSRVTLWKRLKGLGPK